MKETALPDTTIIAICVSMPVFIKEIWMEEPTEFGDWLDKEQEKKR